MVNIIIKACKCMALMTECLIYDKNERHNFSLGQKSNFSILYKYFSTFLKIIFVYKFIGAYKEAIKNKFHILQMYINSQDFFIQLQREMFTHSSSLEKFHCKIQFQGQSRHSRHMISEPTWNPSSSPRGKTGKIWHSCASSCCCTVYTSILCILKITISWNRGTTARRPPS